MSTKPNSSAFAEFELFPVWEPVFKRFVVRLPVLFQGQPYSSGTIIIVMGKDKKEAIKNAKKHFRKMFNDALKNMKVEEDGQ